MLPQRLLSHGAEPLTPTDHRRGPEQTFLTFPEWYLVHSPAEYASYLQEAEHPSRFPLFAHVGQFWQGYAAVIHETKAYPFNAGYHLRVSVIGASTTVEYGMKGLYEHTVGRLTEATCTGHGLTPEERFAAKVAQDYVDFIRVEPWYEYSFLRALKKLWAETEFFGPNLARKWERKLILSAEYLVKAQYATLIKLGTKAAYGDADADMLVVAENVTAAALAGESKVKVLKTFDDGSALLSLPRYEEFREAVLRLTGRGVAFREIAGNGQILLTCVVPSQLRFEPAGGRVLFARPILTEPARKRIGIAAEVSSLHRVLRQLADADVEVEHIYDY